jgi:hypothetical protein
MPTATAPSISAQLSAVNKITDKPRAFVRTALAILANTVARPATAVVPGITSTAPALRPAYALSRGLVDHYDAVSLMPSADGLSTDFKIELPYSAAVLAHGADVRASLTQITPLPLILKPLVGSVSLATPVDIAERYLYDLAIDLGAKIGFKTNLINGKTEVVLSGSIAQPLAALLLDDAPGGGGGNQ